MNKLKLFVAALIISSPMHLLASGMMDSTYPEHGAMLMQQAKRVEMHFKSPVKVANVKVVSGEGVPIAITYDRHMFAAMAMERITIELPDLKPDTYTVYWEALAEDGQSMDGKFGFMQH